LVAGSSGIIGRSVISKISSYGNIFSINKSSMVGKNCVSLDLTIPKNVDKFIEKNIHFDILIFLVGLAHSKGSNASKDLHIKTNYESIVNCLNSMKKHKKVPNKIIFFSTISVYGEDKNKFLFNEKSHLKPVSPYAISKMYAEEYLKSNFPSNSWVLRLAPVYSTDFQLNIERRTKIKNIYYKPGDGAKKLSLCNILNINNVIANILDDNIPSGLYNISDKVQYSYNNLLKKVNAKNIVIIPNIIFNITYAIGKLFKITFLVENSVKLLTDNLYPSKKIQNFVKLNHTLFK
jgi:nucleoside-diphosphate-sugar epimerase